MRWWLMASIYMCLGAVGAALSWWKHDGAVFRHPSPVFHLPEARAHVLSSVLGLLLMVLVVAITPKLVQTTHWARELHLRLRPIALEMTPGVVLLTAGLSSVSEELVFRSFLSPWLGVVPQAVVFGLLHQVQGSSRWAWVVWASLMGLAFGVVHAATGSLLGPLIAHAGINALNLRYLRRFSPGH